MKRTFIIHPILIAIFPMLFLYANNIREMSFGRILIPMAVTIGVAVVLWVLLRLLLKSWAKAALAATIFIFFASTYGHFYNFLQRQNIPLPGHVYMISIGLLLFGACVYIIYRSRRAFRTTTSLLNIATAVMLAINIYTIAAYNINLARMPLPQPVAAEQPVQKEPGRTPDIYFIILDEYANPDVIKEIFGYDNESFVRSLENKGFFVARNSTMHNSETDRALSSILNMEYTPETEEAEVSYHRIVNNEVVRFLKTAGYKYVYLGQWYEIDRYQIEADTYLNYYKATESGPISAEFANTLWDTTILSPFYDAVSSDSDEEYFRNGLIRTLEHLVKTPQMEGPKLVFAHIMSPHPPFVFGPNGEHVDTSDFWSEDKKYYLDQYIFITREIDRVIEQILKSSPQDPIIIVQSDHGPRWIDGWDRILNAYHLPGNGKSVLTDDISPVNTFRVIFNYYFNANFERLQDYPE